ncbi:MAG: hypothetical protein HN929_14085 [Chloroflexi bacterium]|nr:hypothetical protein [Chloroflexota bacterium]MBT7082565.1 hypothetical protein [Chloroflexota bacterium]MBT7289110.1 hypothetical protein [Chloroflexota bacterium]
MDTVIGAIWIIGGLVLIATGVTKWDPRKRSPIVRLIIKSMTEARVRSTFVLLGLGLIVVGILWMTNVIT